MEMEHKTYNIYILRKLDRNTVGLRINMINFNILNTLPTSYNKKAVKLMAQLIKFYKFYYLLYLIRGG